MVNNSNNVANDAAAVMLIDLSHETKIDGGERTSNQKKTNSSVSPFCANKEFRASVVTLPDPTSGEERQYLVIDKSDKECNVFEIQSIKRPGSYGSYFVGSSRVISNSAMHLSTRVDPLFFVLSSLHHEIKTTTNSGQALSKWQPLDQLLSNVPPVVKRALHIHLVTENIDKKKLTGGCCMMDQMKHFCESTDQFGDDMILYKFSEDRVTSWLMKKHARATEAVRQQMLQSKRRIRDYEKKTSQAQGGTGAFSSVFMIPEAEKDEEKKEEVTPAADNDTKSMLDPLTLSKDEEKQAREAGLQLICEYLCDDWRNKLIEALDMSPDDLLSEKQKRKKESTNNENVVVAKRKVDWEAIPGEDEKTKLLQYSMGFGSGSGGNLDETSQQHIKKIRAQSAGLKRLAKVNTKGMKSLANFFGAGAKKKKT